MNPVIMLCHNALELTKKAVESVLQQDIRANLICVDNASTDGTAEWLEEKLVLRRAWGGSISAISVWKTQRSVALAWNIQLDRIFRDGRPFITASDYALVVNNDVVLRSDTYRELLADGGPFVTGVGVGDMKQIEGPFIKSPSPHPDFSCFLIRREVWEKVGPFDENFKGAYCEDLDYHVRMQMAGIRAVNIAMPFYHHVSGTLKNASPEEAQRIQDQANKNREYFKQKWGVAVGSPEYYAKFESIHWFENKESK